MTSIPTEPPSTRARWWRPLPTQHPSAPPALSPTRTPWFHFVRPHLRTLFGIFVVVVVTAKFLSGDSKPDVAVELLPNDMGVYATIRVVNIGKAEIEIQRVVVNGEKETTGFIKGLFESTGKLPVKLVEGQQLIFINPIAWGTRTTRVTVKTDGKETEFTFEN